MPRMPRNRSNVAALESTLRALDEAGRLELVDAAQVQAARAMAKELDRTPSKAALWREYHQAIERLRGDESDTDEIDELLAKLRAPVRDPQAP